MECATTGQIPSLTPPDYLLTHNILFVVRIVNYYIKKN